ncbi:MAG: adenosylcobinamide-phosphate synthase CbiB [Alphaproteobacteria bacterium]|nr:adenosylcobinamide-phosphate synthase CbiB [Alphaproteobacteria bacterium]
MEPILTAIQQGAASFFGTLPQALPHALILVLAIMIDAIIGDPRALYRIIPHPVVLIGKPIAFLDRRLNRPERGEKDRLARGAVTVLLVVGGCAAIGYGLDRMLTGTSWGWMVEAVIVSIFLAARSLHDHVRRVGTGLRIDGLEGGRRAIAHIVSRDPKSLDRHGVARSAIESLSENFSDGVVAPIFFYLLFGLPGLLAYKAINTLDSMIAYKTSKYRSFGFTAAKLDDLANWLPARISGVLICFAACFTPTSYPIQAVKIMLRDANKHKSPNGGWPEGAFAGALNIALGGPRTYPGGEVVGVWIGDGRARLEPRDIDRSRALYIVANMLLWFAILFGGIITLL